MIIYGAFNGVYALEDGLGGHSSSQTGFTATVVAGARNSRVTIARWDRRSRRNSYT